MRVQQLQMERQPCTSAMQHPSHPHSKLSSNDQAK